MADIVLPRYCWQKSFSGDFEDLHEFKLMTQIKLI
jgi:hypothetical protein